MEPRLDVSVIVPFFDEEESVGPLAVELDEAMRDFREVSYEVVWVNDGSSDGGAEIVSALSVEDPRHRLLSHTDNLGKSAALATGFAASRGRLLVTLDADLQNPPAEIPRLLRLMDDGEWDVVLGVRAERRDTWTIRAASRTANRVRRWVLRDGVDDIGCGLIAFRRELLDELPHFDGLHRFLPAFWRARGARIVQTPVDHRPRRYGESKYTIGGRLRRGVVDVFGVRWLISRSVHGRSLDEESKE